MKSLYRDLYKSLQIRPGPETPEGVFARVVEGRTLYVNTTAQGKDVSIDGSLSGLLTGKVWRNTLHLDAYDVDLLQRQP